jgi:hypothetical protein
MFLGANYLTWLQRRSKEKRKTKTVNLKLNGPSRSCLYKTQMAFRPALFVKKNWRITRNQIWRHFTTKHASFGSKYPACDARKKAVEELRKSQEKTSSVFNYWMQSSNTVNIASFIVSQEIAKRGKPYTGGEYIKSFINASEELFRDFKNKAEILKKN